MTTDVQVRLIGHDKLPLNVRGISRVNMWGYGDRIWVGLSVEARWDEWLLLHCRILRFQFDIGMYHSG